MRDTLPNGCNRYDLNGLVAMSYHNQSVVERISRQQESLHVAMHDAGDRLMSLLALAEEYRGGLANIQCHERDQHNLARSLEAISSKIEACHDGKAGNSISLTSEVSVYHTATQGQLLEQYREQSSAIAQLKSRVRNFFCPIGHCKTELTRFFSTDQKKYQASRYTRVSVRRRECKAFPQKTFTVAYFFSYFLICASARNIRSDCEVMVLQRRLC